MDEPTPPVRFTRTSDGVSIAYMVWPGQGVPFLRPRALGAIPMGPGGTHVEEPRRFAGDRPMVQFDWRGTGRSARRIPASMGDLHLDVDAVMSVIESDVVDVVVPGSAFLACTYAASRGERWRSLMLTDPSLRLDGSTRALLWRPGWEADYVGHLATMTRHFLPPMSNEETERIARSWAETVPIEARCAFESIEQKIDLTDTLSALHMPVLILKVVHGSRADSVAALLPNGILLERRAGYYSRRLREQWDQYIGSQFADPPQPPAQPQRPAPMASLPANPKSSAFSPPAGPTAR